MVSPLRLCFCVLQLKLLKYLYPEPAATLHEEIKKRLCFNSKRGTFFAVNNADIFLK